MSRRLPLRDAFRLKQKRIQPPSMLAVVAAFFILPRLSLALPAVALGERLSLSEAWRMTRNNAFRLALASLVCAVPTVAAFELYSRFTDPGIPSSHVIAAFLYLASHAVLVIFAVTPALVGLPAFRAGRWR